MRFEVVREKRQVGCAAFVSPLAAAAGEDDDGRR